MFIRGISDEFETALFESQQWKKIAQDEDLYFAMRNEYVNVYYKGCSIFNISYKKNRLRFTTHYKYLIHPYMKDPYVSWHGEGNAIKDRVDKGVFIERFDTKLLKKAASYYAGAEKEGVHKILKNNKNIVDVEIALSVAPEKEQNSEDEIEASKAHADRIDFIALQRIDGTARIVFFEAKRFENPELRSMKVLGQIEKYEILIAKEKEQIETSYFKVCKNLHRLAPERWDDVVKQVAERAIKPAVDPRVRLVVFGYDAGERDGIWSDLKKKLSDKLLILSKGDPTGFVQHISKYKSDTPS